MKIIRHIILMLRAANSNLKITYRIFIYNILIILLSISTVSFFFNKILTNAIIDKAEKNSSRELSLISNNLASMVDTIDNYSINLSINKDIQNILTNYPNLPVSSDQLFNTSDNLRDITNSIIGIYGNIASSNIMSLNGELYDISSYDNTSLTPLLNSSFIDKIYSWPKPYWFGPYKLQLKYNDYRNTFLIVKAVVDLEYGNVLGAIFFYIDERSLSSTYMNGVESDKINFYIIDNNNEIISSSQKSVLYKNFNNAMQIGDSSSRILASEKRLIINNGDKPTLVIMHDFDKLNWKLVSTVPIDDITAENKIINGYILLIGALCLIIAMIASFFLSKSITKPIRTLTHIMENVTHSNMDIRANVSTNDEIGLLSLGFNHLMVRIGSLLDEVYAEQKEKREYEYKLLQSQIKPHFLYNTLETIISFIKLNMSEYAISAVKYLATFYRISLSKGNDIITIENEIQLTTSYLSIQRLRYTEYIDFIVEVDDDIMPFIIPKLTLQPLVENAIYHGLKEKNEKGIIRIRGFRDNDCIVFEVYDNGKGIPQEKIDNIMLADNQRSDEFGLGSVNRRIKLLYGNQYGLSISSEVEQYTRITVKLPVEDGDQL